MTFAEWIAKQPPGVYTRLQHATGLGYNTPRRAAQGHPVSGAVAKALSDATRPAPDQPPAVSIEELVCPPPLEEPAKGAA